MPAVQPTYSFVVSCQGRRQTQASIVPLRPAHTYIEHIHPPLPGVLPNAAPYPDRMLYAQAVRPKHIPVPQPTPLPDNGGKSNNFTNSNGQGPVRRNVPPQRPRGLPPAPQNQQRFSNDTYDRDFPQLIPERPKQETQVPWSKDLDEHAHKHGNPVPEKLDVNEELFRKLEKNLVRLATSDDFRAIWFDPKLGEDSNDKTNKKQSYSSLLRNPANNPVVPQKPKQEDIASPVKIPVRANKYGTESEPDPKPYLPNESCFANTVSENDMWLLCKYCKFIHPNGPEYWSGPMPPPYTYFPLNKEKIMSYPYF